MADRTTKLLIKNLPPELNQDDKTDLLKVFGATEVICFDNKGKLKNSVFASFQHPAACASALKRLHQLEILGCKLRVEFAGDIHEHLAKTNTNSSSRKKSKAIQRNIGCEEEKDELSNAIAPKLGMHHSFPKHLSYLYPPPAVTTLTNIANALATVPRFYTQVLHLMNKMNLPPPFTGPTITPPLPDDTITLVDACVDTNDLGDYASSEESEIESDAEHSVNQKLFGGTDQIAMEPTRKRKRLRPAVVAAVTQKTNQQQQQHVGEAFEPTQHVTLKRIEFKLAANIAASLRSLSASKPPQHDAEAATEHSALNKEGFGLFDRNKDVSTSEDEFDDETQNEFISAQQIKSSKMDPNDLALLSQMKNYEKGERSNRLYIKNLAKSTTEEDLAFVFKRFIRQCDESQKEKFQIRLMKEGRMKGQAFVTFPTDRAAERALDQTHGFVLHDRPMITQYGRAAKSKD